ncbi:hypothetical protein QAD02_022771 [Eretmocerus hayati]|uniref:Uncharacterized protein n=1 Tax=Eretmocerus hayati TaxID=131215 RepID=A0ACC2PU61_9HYME|nr:hypothetical protein QAD02_022771 [Eretmocerus hayati]
MGSAKKSEWKEKKETVRRKNQRREDLEKMIEKVADIVLQRMRTRSEYIARRGGRKNLYLNKRMEEKENPTKYQETKEQPHLPHREKGKYGRRRRQDEERQWSEGKRRNKREADEFMG